MKYRALALDLDGTLTDSDKKVTPKTKSTLFEAAEKGVKIILASGRPTLGIRAIAAELELYEHGGYIMAFNGGEITDCESGTVIRRLTLPPDCIPDVCAVARDCGVNALTYTESEIVSESDSDEYVLKEKRCINAPVRRVENLSRFVDYATPKMLVVGPHEKLVCAEKKLKLMYGNRLSIFYSEPYFLEVCPSGVSKSTGLAAITAHMGITADELMVCGDGLNDITMMEYAGLSVAMANSCPRVLELADFVTLSNDEDGVAAAVEKFVLGRQS